MFLEDLITESYENLLEFQNEIHELDMKMIKCEHTAIVNEDTKMILLAEEEYTSKFKATMKTLWNKIIEKLEEFIIFIRKTIDRFRKAFLLNKDFKLSFDLVIKNKAQIDSLNDIVFKKGKGQTYHNEDDGDAAHIKSLEKTNIVFGDAFAILNNPKEFDEKLGTSLDTIIGNNTFDEATARQALNNFAKFGNRNGTIKHTFLEKQEIINAYEILTKYGPEWVKLFEGVRNKAKQQSKVIFNSNPDKNAALQASIFQRLINKGIMYIQSVMTMCFKICYAIKSMKLSDIDESVFNLSEVNKQLSAWKKSKQRLKAILDSHSTSNKKVVNKK